MVSVQLQMELDDLRNRYGVTLDAITADELIGLVDCCRRIENPYGDIGESLSELPVAKVGGACFYQLTVGASIWLDEYAAKWWGNDDTCYFWALVFAMVHAHERDTFAALTDRCDARMAILKTCLRFTFSKAAVEKAVDRALGRVTDQPEKSGADNAQTDWVAFLARLETQTGIRKEEWLWGRSASYTIRAYQDLHKFASSYSANGSKVRVFDAMDRAINALARLKKSIKDRLEKEAAANG